MLSFEVMRPYSCVVPDFSSVFQLFITSAFEDLKLGPGSFSAPCSYTLLPKFSNNPGVITLVSLYRFLFMCFH